MFDSSTIPVPGLKCHVPVYTCRVPAKFRFDATGLVDEIGPFNAVDHNQVGDCLTDLVNRVCAICILRGSAQAYLWCQIRLNRLECKDQPLDRNKPEHRRQRPQFRIGQTGSLLILLNEIGQVRQGELRAQTIENRL